MKIFLLIWGILNAGLAGVVLSMAQSAIQEIVAAIGFLMFTVSFGFVGVIDAVQRLSAKLRSGKDG